MTCYEGVKNALQKGNCFSQGHCCVNSEYYGNNGGYVSNVFYYGYKVFTYILKPVFDIPENEEHSYDLQGFIGKPKAVKLINSCLEAINAKYRVRCSKGQIEEVPVSKSHAT